jgi:ribosomal protein S18 acetylase RimI-like enzyme
MPIYENPNSIEVSDNKNFVVNMEWISHYIYYTEESEFNKDDKKFSEKLKEKSMKLIKSLWLDILPAAWVIYVYKKWEDFYIEPVVYVKSIDTLFYETACWSWTTALWMAEALKNENSVNDLSVYQPSWKVIKISVDYDNNNWLFKKAIIKWPVDELVAWDLEQDSNYSVESCNWNSSILESWLNFWLINLYKDCFKWYPYFELFTDEKIKDIFKTYNDRWDIYFAKDKWEVIGFSAFVDLEWEKEIVDVLASYIRNKWWILGKCKYVADLWVKEEFRNNNIWRILILEIIKELSSGDILIMRTSENNYKSWNLFKSLWFEKIKWVEQQTLSKRQDWQITTDTRIFSFYIKK